MSLTLRASVLLIVGLGAGLVALAVLGQPTPAAAALDDPDPGAAVTKVGVMAELSPGAPLRLALSGEFENLRPGSTRKLFMASQSHYAGSMTAAAVETLVGRGRGEVLEHRLSTVARAELAAALAEFDEALRDVSLLIDETETDVKSQLRQRPDRQIRIATRPPERDPAFHDLVMARSRLPAKDGVIWGEIDGPGERHLIVRFEEWPALEQMYDDRFHMLAERSKRVREWVGRSFRVGGMALFEVSAGSDVAAARSPAAQSK